MDSNTLITLAFLAFYLLFQFLRKKPGPAKTQLPSPTKKSPSTIPDDDQTNLSQALSEIREMLSGSPDTMQPPARSIPSSSPQTIPPRPASTATTPVSDRQRLPSAGHSPEARYTKEDQFEHRPASVSAKPVAPDSPRFSRAKDPFRREAAFERRHRQGDKFATHTKRAEDKKALLDESNLESPVQSHLHTILRNSASIREAVILSEILAPPVSRRKKM